MMSPKRIPLARRSLTPYLLAVVFCVFLSGTVYGNDSTCIVCHTDEDLLEENLGTVEKKTSALQAGSG